MKLYPLLLLAGLALVHGQEQNNATPLVQFAVRSVDFKSAGMDQANLEVKAQVVVSRDVTVKRIRFESMRIGNIPIFINPLESKFQVKAGQDVFLPPIPVTVFYRDLAAMKTLQSAIESGEIQVNGHARVDLNLTMLDKVQLMQWAGKSDMPISTKIALTVPGGETGKKALLAGLRLAEQAVAMAGPMVGKLFTDDGTTQAMLDKYRSSILFAESHYSVMLANGKQVDLVQRGLGFRISDTGFAVTAEMLEPWKYDADVALYLELKEATVVEGSADLWIWAADASGEEPARKLSTGEIKLDKIGGKSEGIVFPRNDKHTKVQLSRRDVDTNMALLTFTREQDYRPAIAAAPQAAAVQGAWNKLAVFRFVAGGKLELIWVPVRKRDGRLVLDSPVDETAFGSPILSASGMIGMVQDERSAVLLVQ